MEIDYHYDLEKGLLLAYCIALALLSQIFIEARI